MNASLIKFIKRHLIQTDKHALFQRWPTSECQNAVSEIPIIYTKTCRKTCKPFPPLKLNHFLKSAQGCAHGAHVRAWLRVNDGNSLIRYPSLGATDYEREKPRNPGKAAKKRSEGNWKLSLVFIENLPFAFIPQPHRHGA